MVRPTVGRSVERHLSQVDRLLPGVVTGFYLVGSVALGAYQEGRSDLGFVAIRRPGRRALPGRTGQPVT